MATLSARRLVFVVAQTLAAPQDRSLTSHCDLEQIHSSESPLQTRVISNYHIVILKSK